jgi:hypothetical protein
VECSVCSIWRSEPWARRFWPDGLKAWTRLITGHILDARVGRDVLIGIAIGLGMVPALIGRTMLEPTAGGPELSDVLTNPAMLKGLRGVLGELPDYMIGALLNGAWTLFLIVVLRLRTKRMWIVWLVATVLFIGVNAGDLLTDLAGSWWINALLVVALAGTMLFAAVRFGLLTMFVTFFVHFVVISSPLTLDPSRWYFPLSSFVLGLVATLAAIAAYAATRDDRATS